MFISVVDQALQSFLQQRVATDGLDVSFATPTPDWVAQLSGPTVNLFLQRIQRSDALVRSPQRRFDANGRPERRGSNVQMIDLGYVVTAWAGDAESEHALLSQVVSLLAATPVLPASNGAVSMSFGAGEPAPAGPYSVAGPLKAYALLTVVAAADIEAPDEATAPAGGGTAQD